MALTQILRQRKCLAKLCKSALLVMLTVSLMINISFLVETNRKLEYGKHTDSDLAVGGKQARSSYVVDMVKKPKGLLRSLEIDVLSSKEKVFVKLDGKHVYQSDGFDQDRGIHVLVLNQATGVVMATRVFDTYLQTEDEAMVEFLKTLSPGRILVFAIKDEGTFQLKDNAKNYVVGLGSQAVLDLYWRDMWAFVAAKQMKGKGEKFSRSASLEMWGEPVSLSVNVSLVPNEDTMCKLWPNDSVNSRRREFCDKHEGYGTLCSCDEPDLLNFPRVPLDNGQFLDVPLVIIASNRPQYLFRTLKTLLKTPGVSPEKIIVFIDGLFEEPLEVTRLFDLRGVHHTPVGVKNARISQHYKASLTAAFNFFPNAEYVIILEEDLEVSPDFFNYFHQTMHLLAEDETLYCISAWNDQGYEHSCKDPALLYRIETMPGLGWMMKKSLFIDELEPQWPSPEKQWDWDMWMRHGMIRKSRECIIPDISRTYHFGSKGLNINPYFQELYFQSHKLQSKPNVKLKDIDKMTSYKYEELVRSLIRGAKVLDHSKDPCAEDFIPKDTNVQRNLPGNRVLDRKNDRVLEYSNMYTLLSIHLRDSFKLTECYKLWDLDVRGFHKSMWRQYLKGEHLVIVGVPASPYAEFKPADVTPIYLEDKEKQKKEGEKEKT